MNQRRLSVLLVEDNEDDYLIVREYLEEIFPDGFHLDWFDNTRAAELAMQFSAYDIALVEHHIGGDFGIDFISKIPYLTETAPATILLTGNSQENIDKEVFEAGAEGYLLKTELSPALLKITIRDAQARKYVQSKLVKTETRMQLILETMHDGLFTVNRQYQILSANPSMSTLFGYDNQQFIGMNSLSLLPEDFDSEKFSKSYFETTMKHRDGYWIPVEISVSISQMGEDEMYILVVRDITERKDAMAQIEFQAHYDTLTLLPNRRMLMDRLEHAIHEAKRHHYYGALMFLDLDRFKQLNDLYGHAAGDELLVQVAARLSNILRDIDTVARLGGDEFVILLTHLDEDEGRAIAAIQKVGKKIRQVLNEPYIINNNECTFSSSIGVTLFPKNDDSNSVQTILHHADAAMYRAKQDGRNLIRYYHESIQSQAELRLTIENELRLALIDEQFELVYQPHLERESKLTGCEALIRWHHPTKGIVSPDNFIRAAEESGQIIPIGDWVLDKALSQKNRFFGDNEECYMSVNISPAQFRQADFVYKIQQLLNKHQCEASQLVLELTENLMLENINDSIQKILSLNAIGVKTSIDDFGTGYSSLSYLSQLPIRQIKIDKLFIQNLRKEKTNQIIVEAILAMATKMGIEVIAEGVEDVDSYLTLLDYGCSLFQGYHFSKPLYADEFEAMVHQQGKGTQIA